jgi:tetratricopeptide (TPR) repeat protein
MIRSVKMLFLAGSVACATFAQSAPAAPPSPATDTKAGAYYNFAMGRLYAELAAAEGSREDVNKAIHYYQEAIKLDPKAGLVLEELTDLYIKTNRLADAVEQAEGLLKQDPNNLDARRTLAQIYTHLAIGDTPNAKIDEGYLHKAIDQYQKVTQQAPKDADSWSYLGRLYRASSDSASAEKAFNSALEAEPDNEDALTGLAAVYADMGDSAKALEKLKAAADKSPNERTLSILAQQYENMNDYKSAADVLQRAVALEPDDERLQRELAQDLAEAGQLDESLKTYQQLASDNPREPLYRLQVARICRFKHDFPAAERALASAQMLDADNIEVRHEQVYLLEAEGKTDEAISSMKSLLDTLPHRTYSGRDGKIRAALERHLGLLYRDAKQYPAAIEAFRQFATLDSDDDAQTGRHGAGGRDLSGLRRSGGGGARSPGRHQEIRGEPRSQPCPPTAACRSLRTGQALERHVEGARPAPNSWPAPTARKSRCTSCAAPAWSGRRDLIRARPLSARCWSWTRRTRAH